LGVVPQEPVLFSTTVAQNIAFARPDAPSVDVSAAAVRVGAGPIVAQLPDGIDTPVSARGRSLSAGQRQLIALARADLADPQILLLDEATAQLDLATEARVQEAMGMLAENRTTIVVAHRLETARRADRILVLQDGLVVEDGPHEALLATDGAYASLWRMGGAP
jgi:ABC-type multidrug transport system fused ATPase/permease subunit